MKLISRNVNGIRAVLKKGFIERFTDTQPDILCIQETKAFAHQCPPELNILLAQLGYEQLRHQGTRPGYAGTTIFYKSDIQPTSAKSLWEENHMFNTDGRVTELQWDNLILLNCYFPNGGTRADGTEMLTFKLAFYDEMIHYANDRVKKGKNIIITGDFNICHTKIDLARPENNQKSIGFLPIEREKISEFLSNGYVDVFRHFYPNTIDHYTRWSYRAGARAKNVGRRLDYAIVNERFIPNISSFQHLDNIMGSDHCPIQIEWK